MRKYLAALAVAVACLGASAPASAARHDTYPLHPGSAGPRVCALQWLLGGHRPSVWRSPKGTTFHAKPNCIYGPRTDKAVRVAKYRFGWPLSETKPGKTRASRYFVSFLMGKVKRPAAFIGRDAARAHPAVLAPLPGYPLARKATICGVPGVGTHSFTAEPNNWQSDRALDLCVPAGTYVLAVKAGTICSSCGFGPFGVDASSRFAGSRFDLSIPGDDVYYTHLGRIDVKRGQSVKDAQRLGLSGSANGVQHLHIACRVCDPYTLGR